MFFTRDSLDDSSASASSISISSVIVVDIGLIAGDTHAMGLDCTRTDDCAARGNLTDATCGETKSLHSQFRRGPSASRHHTTLTVSFLRFRIHAYRHYMLNHRSIVTKYFTYVDWTYDRCEGTMASRSDDDMTLGPYQLSTLGPYQLSASLHPQAMASAVISWLH
jgi:hypothetical protein